MFLYRYIVLFLVLSVTQALAQTTLWEVTAPNGNKAYLGGTLHLLKPEDYPLPSAFQKAYDKSSRVVFETDIYEMPDRQFQLQWLAASPYRNGQTLSSVLSPATYREYESYCISRNIDCSQFEGTRVGMVIATLLVYEYKQHGLTAAGVDQYFTNKALADKKPVMGLESMAEQISLMANLGKGFEDLLMIKTLEELSTLDRDISVLTDYWRNGTAGKFYEEYVKPMEQDFPELYRDMLLNRNIRWVEQLTPLLEDKEAELILVGSAHLLGEMGLVKLLESRGYKLKQL